jgi:hypothetical protein
MRGAGSTGFAVVIRGRPRKAGDREPNGRARRDRGDVRDLGLYNRARELARKELRVAVGEIGRWEQRERLLSRAQAETLCAFARHVGEYEALMGFPRRSARSAAFEVGHRGVTISIVPGSDDRRIQRVKRRHEDLMAVIPSGEWRDAVFALAVEDTQVNPIMAKGIIQIVHALQTILGGDDRRRGGIRSWRGGA